MHYLVSKDSKGKLRVVELSATWEEDVNGYVIHRTSYQYGGKHTKQPDIFIKVGKASRTLREQLDLEYKSNLKKYLDKGYKLLKLNIVDYTQDKLYEIVGNVVTDSSGFAKHMLAKKATDVKDSSIEKVKIWYVSRKIDG